MVPYHAEHNLGNILNKQKFHRNKYNLSMEAKQLGQGGKQDDKNSFNIQGCQGKSAQNESRLFSTETAETWFLKNMSVFLHLFHGKQVNN